MRTETDIQNMLRCSHLCSNIRRHFLALDFSTRLSEAKHSHVASGTLQRRRVNHEPSYNSNQLKSNTILTVSLCFYALLSCNATCRVCVKCIPLSQTWLQGTFQIHQPQIRLRQYARKKWNTSINARFFTTISYASLHKEGPVVFFFVNLLSFTTKAEPGMLMFVIYIIWKFQLSQTELLGSLSVQTIFGSSNVCHISITRERKMCLSILN